MIDSSVIIKGLILGFLYSAPIGPIGILCIRRTIQYGKISGILSGMGSAFVQIIWSAVAAFGLSSFASSLDRIEPFLNLFGGLFLVVVGAFIMRSNPVKATPKIEGSHWLSDISSTFTLTFTNPLAILTFFVFYEDFGLSKSSYSLSNGSLLIAAIFLGSLAWWVLLSCGTFFLREKIDRKILKWINLSAGLLIIAYGLFCASQFFFPNLFDSLNKITI